MTGASPIKVGEARAVQCRRHRDQPQIGPQRCLRVERQRQAEIAVQAALVHFVEEHRRNPGQLRIALDAAQEDALGEHGDPGARRTLAVEPRRIADRPAHRLAGQRRHPLRRRARGETARREEEDFAAAPGFVEQSRRHRRRLARPGRRDEDGVRPAAQMREQVGEDGGNGEGAHVGFLSLCKKPLKPLLLRCRAHRGTSMTAPFLSLAAELKAKAALAPADILSLRRIAWPDGRIDPAEAEAIFDLNDAVRSADREWLDFFVEAMNDYVVRQTAPAGYVDEAKAQWLIARIDRDGRVDSLGELELLVKILEDATNAPASLKSYALSQIETAVLTGSGPTRGGDALDPGSVNAAEAGLLRRILFAQAGDGPACVSRAEADMLFRIKDLSLGAANAPEWDKFFVQAVGNHLMAYNSYRPLARDEAARLDAFVGDNQASVGGFFRRMAAAGLSGFSSGRVARRTRAGS